MSNPLTFELSSCELSIKVQDTNVSKISRLSQIVFKTCSIIQTQTGIYWELVENGWGAGFNNE